MCFKKKERYKLTYESMKRASYIICFIMWAPYSDNIDLTEEEKEKLENLMALLEIEVFKKYHLIGWGKYKINELRKAYECEWNFINKHKSEIEPFLDRLIYWNEVTENNNYAGAAMTDARAVGINYLAEEMNASSNN